MDEDLKITGNPEEDARELFTHGALHALSREDRTQRALEAALAQIPRRVSVWQRLRPAATWMSAAAVLLAVVLLALRPGDELLADVDRIAERTSDGVDRSYVGHVQLDDADELEYRLYARGQKFAISFARRGRELWLGHNGSEDWFVPAARRLAVLVGPRLLERAEVTGPKGPLAGQRVPFLRVQQLLRGVRMIYELKEGDEASDTRIDVIGRRLEGASSLRPDRIRIVATRENFRLERLELEWESDRRGRKQRNVLRFVEETPLDDELFEHRGHHGPERRIRHVEGSAEEMRRR